MYSKVCFFEKRDLHGKGFEDKRDCDLCSKGVKDKVHKNLNRKDQESLDLTSPAYLFEENNVDGKVSENLRIWGRSCAN